MGPQRRDHQRGELECAAAAGHLRLHEPERPLDPLELEAHGERATFQVEVLPPEAQELALAQAHARRHDIERLQVIPACGRQQALDVLHLERAHLAPLHLRRAHQLGGVPGNQVPLLRLA